MSTWSSAVCCRDSRWSFDEQVTAMDSPASSTSVSSLGLGSNDASSFTQHLKDLLKLNGSGHSSSFQDPEQETTPATSTASLASGTEAGLQALQASGELAPSSGRPEQEDVEFEASGSASELLCSMGEQIITKQQILLQGDDQHTSFSVYGRDVVVITSEASSCTKPTGSNKVRINPVVNFEWEHRNYIGNLVAVHRNGIHVAYTLRGKSGGVVRVINRKTAERALLKGFSGRVIDVSFAHLNAVLLGSVDEVGAMSIHDISETPDNKLEARLVLQITRPESTLPSEHHRLIWCPYIPEDDDCSASTMNSSESVAEDVGRLLVLTHRQIAEMWNVDTVTKEYGSGPLQPSEVDVGFLTIDSHSGPILDASFSPDGTALATASQDGDVKFFQVYLQDKSAPRCLHQWQPHEGKPVNSLFFLDDHKHPNPEVQYWKFALTGADSNREIKVWSCESWTCLQTLNFMAQPDLPSNFQIEPCIKLCLDLSANYLALSDIRRKVMYILQLYQDSEASRAHVSSVAEFLLAQPCLSLALLDASRHKLRRPLDQESNGDHVGDLTTGEVAEDQEEEEVIGTDADSADVGVLVRMYAVHTKAMQELQIRYHPESSVPQLPPGSFSSTSLDDRSLHDPLSDVSMDTVSSEQVSEHSEPAEPTSTSLPTLDLLGSGPPPAAALSAITSIDHGIPHRPLLMTPDAFVAHSPRPTDSVLVSSGSSSFTQVTAMDDALQTPRGFISQSQPSPGSSLTITPTSSRDLSTQATPTSVPLPPSTPGEEKALMTPEAPHSPPFSGRSHGSSSVSQEFMTSSPASAHKHGEFKPPSEDTPLPAEAQRRSMLQSTGSSSSTSLEVSEILEGAHHPGQDMNYEENTEEEDAPQQQQQQQEEQEDKKEEAEDSKDADIEEEGETDIQEQVQEGSEILPAQSLDDSDSVQAQPEPSSADQSWPKAPQVDEDAMHGHMQAKRLAWEAIERAQRAEALRMTVSDSEELVVTEPEAGAEFQADDDVKIEEDADEEEDDKEENVAVALPSAAVAAPLPSAVAASGEPAAVVVAAAVDNVAVTQLQKSVEQLMLLVQSQQQQIEDLKGDLGRCSQASQLDAGLKKIQTALGSQLADGLNRHSQLEAQRLKKALNERETRDRQKTEQLETRLCEAACNKLDSSVRDAMTRSVMPGVTRQVESLKEQLHTEMAQKLTATDALMKDNIAKLVRSRQTVDSIGQAAGNALQGAIQGVSRDLLIPSFDRACQTLFQQLNHTFQRGTHEYVQQLEVQMKEIARKQEEAREPVLRQLQTVLDTSQTEANRQQAMLPQLQTLSHSLESSVQQLQTGQRQLEEDLHSTIGSLQDQVMRQVRKVVQEELAVAMKDTQTSLSDQLLNAMRCGAVTPVSLGPDPQQQQAHIMQLLRQGQLNTAFQQALSASDLNLVMFVCETVSVSQIFSQTPCALQQPVLLSLIQQLSADLSGNTELKHNYLEESVMNLDQGNAITQEHMPAVLGPLCQKLVAYVQNNPQDRMSKNMRMLLMATQSLLK